MASPIRPGVLNKEQLSSLKEREIISCPKPLSIDASALDLHVSECVWEMTACIKPRLKEPFSEVLCDQNLSRATDFKENKIILNRKKVYVFKLMEKIDFKKQNKAEIFNGKATGKSSIGRLDVLARLVVNGHPSYDEIPPYYDGDLYLEVMPITFNVAVSPGLALAQLRIFNGAPEYSEIDESVLKYYPDMLLDDKGKDGTSSGIALSLQPEQIMGKNVSAFAAKQTEKLIDLTQKEPLNPNDFWELVTAQGTSDEDLRINIDPERFFILRSRERFNVPSDVCVYAQAVTENLGEIRIHYAGFVHPGFGASRADRKGTPLIFEVRGHNATTYLRNGEILAKIRFYKMSKETEPEESFYSSQELTLSKYFGKWDK